MNRGHGAGCRLWFVVFGIIVSLGLLGRVEAQQQLKVGVVDLQTVLDSSAHGKVAKDRLKKLSLKLQEEIKAKRGVKDKREEELRKLQQDIRAQGFVLSPEAREAKREAFRKKVRELKRFIGDTNRFIEDTTQEFREKEVRQTQLLIAEIRKVVREIGKKEKYSLILEGNESASVVLYFGKAIDLTQKVIQRYDQTSAAKR